MRRKTEEKSPERSSRKGSGFLSLLKKSEQLFFRLLAFFWILFARTYRLFKKTEYGQWLTGKIEPWASLMKDIATILFEKFQSLNAWKKALVSLTIIALIFQSSFMDRWNINLFAWADEKDPLEAIATPEMKELSQVNPDLIQSDNFQKAKKVNELINDEKKDIDYFLGIFPKSKEDAVKGQEVAILKDAKNRMRGGWLSQSKALEETVIRYSNSTNSRTKEAAEKIRELLKQKGLFNSFYDNEEQKEKEISTNLKKEDDTLKPQSVPFEAEIQNSFNQGDSISDLSQGTGTDPADRTDDNGITEPTTIKVTTEAGDKYLTDNTPEFQEKVQIKPLGANPSVGQLADNKVLFKDVFTGVDMLKSVEQTGLKDNYIFKNDTASQEMKFQIATTGLTMRINDQGGMDFYDIFNQLKFTSPRPFIQDKDGNRKDLKYAKDEDSLVQSLTFSSPNEKVERQNILNALSNNQALEALEEKLVLNDNALNGATQEIAQMLGKSTRYVANLFSPSEIKDIMGITGPSSVDLTQSPIFEDATKERTYTVSIKMDFDKMSYPINLDPTISINLQDMGEATFYGDYSQGSTYGKQGFMNGYGSETRSSESFLPKGNLAGYWPMDEASWNGTAGEVKDYSGNAVNGVRSGSANTTGGKFANAGNFSSTTSDYVNMGVPASLEIGTSDFSISAWFRTTDTGDSILMGKGCEGDTSAYKGYYLDINNGRISAGINDGTRQNTAAYGSGYNDGQWHHLVAVFDRDGYFIPYVDGVSLTGESIASHQGSITDATKNTYIGRYGATAAAAFFDGQIDEAALYKRAISAAEVSQIYGGGRIENTDPRVTYVDPDGTRIQGKVGTSGSPLQTNSPWAYYSNASTSNGSHVIYTRDSMNAVGNFMSEKAHVEINFTGTEIWAGLAKVNYNRIFKAVVDEGTANEVVNYIDLYNPNTSGFFQQKILIATGLSNGSHTASLYPVLMNNLSAGLIAANDQFHFDYFEYYASGYELAKKSDITINSRNTSGMDFTNTKDSPAISYDAKGNIPANTSGNQDKGTWSSWVKTDFDWNADNAPHTVFSNENQRLYYQYANDERDVSASNNSVTFNGDANVSTTQKKFGDSSYAFDGSGDYLSMPGSTNFDFSAGQDFTVDFWTYFQSDADNYTGLVMAYNVSPGTQGDGWVVGTDNNGYFSVYDGATWHASSVNPTTGSWYHVAWVRSGSASNNNSLYINGASTVSWTDTTVVGNTQTLNIGSKWYTYNDLNGYIDEVRISKGVARWTSGFTPSTSKYSDSQIDSYTKLLLHGDNVGYFYSDFYNGTNWNTVRVKSAEYSNSASNTFSSGQVIHLTTTWDVTSGANLYVNNNKTSYSGSWTPQAMTGNMKVGGDEKAKLLLHGDGPDGDSRDVDGSGNGYPLTFNGDTKISTAQSKFGGSSYVFDGTGDYVSSPDSEDWNFGNGDFTIDFWARYSEDPNTNTVGFVSQTTDANNRIVTSSVNSGGQTQVGLAAVSGGTILANYYFQETLSANTWYHFAFVRQGSNVYMFRDGVSKTLTVSTAIGSNSFPNLSSNVDIGRAYNSAWSELGGFMDEVRITKGQARWTSNFTPPTGPYQSNMVIAEPAIFNYQLTDVEINSIYKSNVSMGDMLSGKTLSSSAETNQGLFNPGKRIEEVSQTTKSLLFNFPGVQTADARVGSYAGSLYKTTAPTNPTGAAAMNDVNWVGKWSTCATGNCKYTDDPNAYATYTTATNATELWATYNAYADYAIAEYIIDEGTSKEVKTRIDQYYNSTARDQYALIATGLENTTHTVKVRWSGSKNPAANYNRIIVGLGATANKMFIYGATPDIATQNMVVNGKTVPNVLTQDYTTMGNAVNFVPKGNISNSANEGTISTWVQTSWAGNDSTNHYVMATGGAALANGFYINKNTSNQLVFYFYNASAGVNIGSSAFDASTWAPNVPHHIVAKWWRPTSTTFGMALYFDGKKVAENKSQSLTPSFNTNFILGNSSPTPSEASDFDGSLYDLSVWSWAFSDGDTAIGAMAKPTSDVGKSYSGYALMNDEDLSSQADGNETTFKLTHNLVPNQPDDSNWIASSSAKSLSGSGANGNNLVYDSARSRWYTAYSNYLYYSSSADLDTASWTPVYLGTTANFGVRKIYYDSANSLWYMVGYITGTYNDSYVWVSSSSDPVSSTWTRKNLYVGSNNEWVQSMAYDSVNSRWLAVGYLRVEPASTPIQAWLAYSSGSDLSTATWGTSSIQTSASNQQAYDIIYDSNNSLWYVVGGYYPGSNNFGVLWYSNNPTGGTSAWTMTTIESGGTPLAASIIYDQNSDRYLVSGYTYSTSYDTTLWYSSGNDLTSTTWTKKLIDQSSATAYGYGITYDDLKDKFYIVDGVDNYFWPGEIAADSSLSLKDSVSAKSEGASATVSSAKAGGFAKLENPSGGNLSSNDTSITIDPGKTDPDTKLLLHADGANGQKWSIDDSAGQYIPTHSGNAQISTSQSKFGGASYSFDGTNSYVSFSDSNDWNFGSGDFTIDTWVRFNSLATVQEIFAQRTDNSNYYTLHYNTNSSIGLRFSVWSGGVNTISLNQGGLSGWNTGQWYHVAVVRNGNSWNLYRDGISIASTTTSNAIPDLTGSFILGEFPTGTEYLNGYLDEIRITKGQARWTSNFTPESSPYLNTSYDIGSDIDTSGGYLTIGTPGSNKKPETVEYSSYSASTNTFTVSQRGANGTQATSWPNDTPIEVGGTITLSSAPASGSKLLASYNTQSDEVARDRGIIKERLNKVNPLDYTASASTGWALSGDSSAKSGRQQLSTQVAGQNLFGYFEGTDLSYLYSGDSTNGGVSQIIIDEGTSQERKIRSDQNNTITNQSFDNLTSGLSKGYHTARIIGGVDETNAGSNKYTTFDAFLSQNKADLGSPTGNTGSNESKEGNDVNDTQYYPAANDNDNNAGYAMNNDSNTVLLLHNDGTNGGTTFVDSSPSAKTVTNSNALISTAQSKFGGASGSFNGSSSYLSLADSADWQMGNGDFTIDTWVYFSNLTGIQNFVQYGVNNGNQASFLFRKNSDNTIQAICASAALTTLSSITTSYTVNQNTWYHLTYTRNGTNFYLFVNGQLQGNESKNGSIYVDSGTNILNIGQNKQGVDRLNGYLDELRITKGLARWTSNFEPPASSYAPTTLLLHGDGTNGQTQVSDSSGNNKTITNSNTTISTAQAKFGGGSLSFNGAGSYVTVPDNNDWYFSTKDFTIDFWTRFNSTAGCQMFVNQGTGLSSYFQLDYCSGNLNFDVHSSGGNALVGTPYTFNTNTWYHIALVKSGGIAYLYVNGVLATSGASQVIDDWSANLLIGVNFYGFMGGTYDYFNGYLDDFRITKGTARWTSNFTPPISPYNLTEDSRDSSYWLNSNIGASDSSITLKAETGDSLDKLGQPSGVIYTGSEYIRYQSIGLDRTNRTATITNLTRGYNNSTAASHNSGDNVYTKGAWRNNSQARNTSWYKEYGPFPEKALLVGTGTEGSIKGNLSIVDLSNNSTYMKLDANANNAVQAGVKTVSAAEGKIFTGYGTGDSGLTELDFINDQTLNHGADIGGRGYKGTISQANDQKGWASGYDPDPYTKLLIHADGNNASTAFTDSSSSNRTITVTNTTISNVQKKFGGSSAVFNGSSSNLSAPSNSDFAYGTENFTLDAWVNFTALPASGSYMFFYNQLSSGQLQWAIYNNAGTYQIRVYLDNNAGGITNSNINIPTPSTGVWNHFALVKYNNNFKQFMNGVQQGGDIYSPYSIPNYGTAVYFGSTGNSQYYLNGYMDEIRVTKGQARWTSNFAPPSQPYGGVETISPSNDSYNKLLLHADGTNGSTTFVDSSATRKQVTATNATVSTTQSKFGGSSGYFNGTSAYVSSPDSEDWNFAADDFSIDFWMNPSVVSPSGDHVLFGQANASAYSPATLLIRNTKLTLYFSNNGSSWTGPATGTTTITAGSWYHVAVIRNSGYIKIYLNGTQEAQIACGSTLFNSTGSFQIGVGGAGGQFYNGYLDEFRVSKGLARWTSDFTPPSLPYKYGDYVNDISASYDGKQYNIWASTGTSENNGSTMSGTTYLSSDSGDTRIGSAYDIMADSNYYSNKLGYDSINNAVFLSQTNGTANQDIWSKISTGKFQADSTIDSADGTDRLANQAITNAMTMDASSIYFATDSGVKKATKSALSSGVIATLNSGTSYLSPELTIDRCSSIDYDSTLQKLLMGFSTTSGHTGVLISSDTNGDNPNFFDYFGETDPDRNNNLVSDVFRSVNWIPGLMPSFTSFATGTDQGVSLINYQSQSQQGGSGHSPRPPAVSPSSGGFLVF